MQWSQLEKVVFAWSTMLWRAKMRRGFGDEPDSGDMTWSTRIGCAVIKNEGFLELRRLLGA